jgi:hypothetical protein
MIKPDIKQCQAEIPITSFMTMGGAIYPSYKRCKNKPTFIATERKPQKGYKNRGSMSLCEDCKDVAIKQLGKNYAIFKTIKRK